VIFEIPIADDVHLPVNLFTLKRMIWAKKKLPGKAAFFKENVITSEL
jgi:hypothetical protein